MQDAGMFYSYSHTMVNFLNAPQRRSATMWLGVKGLRQAQNDII